MLVSAFFTSNGQPASGLNTSAVSLWLTQINKTNGSQSQIWIGASATSEITNLGGYSKLYPSASLDLYDYFSGASYTGGATLDVTWLVGSTQGINVDSWNSLSLSANNIDVNVASIAGNTDAASRQALGASMIVPGTAISGTLTTASMTTDLTETTDDHYVGRSIIWTTGTLKYQPATVTGYTGSNKMLVFTTTTEAPVAGDEFILV